MEELSTASLCFEGHMCNTGMMLSSDDLIQPCFKDYNGQTP
jgi:hypothetical protein